LIFLLAFALGIFTSLKIHRAEMTFLLSGIVVVWVLILVSNALFRYPFAVRQILPGLPLYLLLVSKGISSIWLRTSQPHTSPSWRFAPFLGLLILCTSSLPGLAKFYNYRKEPWREVAQLIEENMQPGDVIISPGVHRYLRYYLSREAQKLVLDSNALADIDIAWANHPRTWFLLSGILARHDQGGEIQRWLDQQEAVILKFDQGISVFYMRPGASPEFLAKELEPVLRAHFQVIPWREREPVIYRIELK
jgi:hypothetical protein